VRALAHKGVPGTRGSASDEEEEEEEEDEEEEETGAAIERELDDGTVDSCCNRNCSNSLLPRPTEAILLIQKR